MFIIFGIALPGGLRPYIFFFTKKIIKIFVDDILFLEILIFGF
jgi:hypothetical protein